MAENTKRDTIRESSEERNALQYQILEMPSTEAEPEFETLMAYAEGLLERDARVTLQKHLRKCPACSSAVAEFRTLFASTRTLHEGWAGWHGAWQGDRLSNSLERNAWQDHLLRCPRCQSRAEQVRVLCRGGLLRTSLSFVGGVAMTSCAFLLWFRQPVSPKANPNGFEIVGQTDKTGSATGGWVDAPEMLQKFVSPDPKQLPHVIEHWEECALVQPNDPIVWVALQKLYAQQAGQVREATERAEWLRKAEAAKVKVAELLKVSPKGAPAK